MNYKDLCSTAKIHHDIIHGYIGLSKLANEIINTPIFQRLGSLKQLGACRYIYSNAVHTRFEHSIGTYHLAGELLSTISNLDNQREIDEWLKKIPELQNYYERESINEFLLTPYVKELIKIAGLCHDIGHGPFSHLFDDEFLKLTNECENCNKSHEVRSNILIEMVIKDNPKLNIITIDEIEFIKSLINPQKDQRGFVYQIISNGLNGLDVDKYDYLQRDIKMVDFQAKLDVSKLLKYIQIIDNMIVYPRDSADDIENLFRTRYRLYKNIYNHSNVTAVQSIIINIMLELDKIINLSGSINSMDQFITLNDNTILECIGIINKLHFKLTKEQEDVKNKVTQLLNKLYTNEFHTVLHTTVTRTKVNPLKLLESADIDELFFRNITYSQIKVGFLSGDKKNPFETIYFYDYDDPSKIIGNIESLSKSIPVLSSTNTHQEYVTTFFYTANNSEDSDKYNLSEFPNDIQNTTNTTDKTDITETIQSTEVVKTIKTINTIDFVNRIETKEINRSETESDIFDKDTIIKYLKKILERY